MIETAGLKEGDVKAQGLDLSVSAGVGSPACALTTLTYEKKAELVKVHPAAADIDVALAEKTDPIPVHPGSERALNSLGG